MDENLRKYTILPMMNTFITNTKTAAVSTASKTSMGNLYEFLRNNKSNLTETEINNIIRAWNVWQGRLYEYENIPTSTYYAEEQQDAIQAAVDQYAATAEALVKSDPSLIDVDVVPRFSIPTEYLVYGGIAVGGVMLYMLLKK